MRPVRDESERENPHPVLEAFFQHRCCKVFTRDDVRDRVIPAYMGLIAQIDDQIGRATDAAAPAMAANGGNKATR